MKNNIKDIRRQKYYSQQKLADLSGVSRPIISLIENSKITPSTETSLKIANALGVTLDTLFYGKTVLHVEQEEGKINESD